VTLEALYLAAWVEGLRCRNPEPPAVRPVELPPRRVPLDDTGRPPVVPLRSAGGDRG
jgi:hypothetical protein